MPNKGVEAILEGCRQVEAILKIQRQAAGAELSDDFLKSKDLATSNLAACLEKFRCDHSRLDDQDAGAILDAVITLRAHSAANAEFEALRVRLSETLARVHQPASAKPRPTYNMSGSNQPAKVASQHIDRIL
jgi:hypothetical protein